MSDSGNSVGFQWELFSEKQLDFLGGCTHRVNIAVGAVRSGKTIICNLAFLLFVLKSKYTDFLVTAKTRDTAYRNVIKTLMLMMDGMGITYKYKKVDGILQINDGEMVKELHIIGLTDEGSTERLQGSTAGGWLGDEATTYPTSGFDMAYSRCSLPGSRIFLTLNPSTPYHHLYDNYICNTDAIDSGRIGIWEFSLDDNLTLTNEIKNDLKENYRKKGGVFYDRFIKGKWVVADGGIFQNFDEGKHTFANKDFIYPEFDNFKVGVDYGVASQTVFVLAGLKYNEEEDNVTYKIIKEYVYDAEKVQVQTTDSKLVDAMVDFLTGIDYNVINIPHDARSFHAALEQRGFNCNMINPQVNEGIQVMRDLFGNDRLLIHEDCKESIQSIQSYVWDPKALLRGLEKPLKKNDHAVDAIRYCVDSERKFKPIISTAGYW